MSEAETLRTEILAEILRESGYGGNIIHWPTYSRALNDTQNVLVILDDDGIIHIATMNGRKTYKIELARLDSIEIACGVVRHLGRRYNRQNSEDNWEIGSGKP